MIIFFCLKAFIGADDDDIKNDPLTLDVISNQYVEDNITGLVVTLSIIKNTPICDCQTVAGRDSRSASKDRRVSAAELQVQSKCHSVTVSVLIVTIFSTRLNTAQPAPTVLLPPCRSTFSSHYLAPLPW